MIEKSADRLHVDSLTLDLAGRARGRQYLTIRIEKVDGNARVDNRQMIEHLLQRVVVRLRGVGDGMRLEEASRQRFI